MTKFNSRFLIAKYIPDLARMEPRNIGVLLWSDGEIRTKFLPPNKVKGLVSERIYQRWVSFWEDRINQDMIRPSRGEPVSKQSPQCLDALTSTQDDNYILTDGGEFLQRIGKRRIEVALKQLFQELVIPNGTVLSEEKLPSLRRQCDTVVSSLGVDFRKKQPVKCNWKGIPRELHADYYFGNGEPAAIFQRANVSSENSINSAALLVDALLEDQVISSDRCRFLVRWSDVVSKTAEQGLKLFDKLCGVVDIQDDTAPDTLANIVNADGQSE